MKPNKRKAVVSDPIKRIGLNGGNSAREIVIQIAKALGFKIHEDNKGVSAYGGNAIRIADHCTYMQTWVDNETWRAPVRLDVVIEDKPTQAATQVRAGCDFGITEFVSQTNDIDPQKARMIAYDIRNTMNGNPYANNVRGERRNLVATHGNNPQELNCNTNMNKKLIRLTESDLHRIVKESVQKILKEAAYQGNYPGMDNGYGRFEMNHPEGKYSLYFDKAQRDAHNYNAQQQGQTPNPYAGWSKRVNDGKGNWNDAEFNSDDMHMYDDDDASQTAANLRKFDPNGAYHWDMFRGRGDKFRQ